MQDTLCKIQLSRSVLDGQAYILLALTHWKGEYAFIRRPAEENRVVPLGVLGKRRAVMSSIMRWRKGLTGLSGIAKSPVSHGVEPHDPETGPGPRVVLQLSPSSGFDRRHNRRISMSRRHTPQQTCPVAGFICSSDRGQQHPKS